MAIIKGKTRGNGSQLAQYLVNKGENDWTRILDVDGMEEFDSQHLKYLLKDFSQTEKLTKSRQGIYHASINPDEAASQKMSDYDWMKAVDILSKELGFQEQRKAVVLHSKHGRVHAHIAYERFCHETATMKTISHNYRKHDKARAKIEQVFRQQPTQRRNPKRKQMKEELTQAWQNTTNAKAFMEQAEKLGYRIAKGYDRIPYSVVDSEGISFNLRRHIDGVKVKDLRQRFAKTVLPEEKDAIAFIRDKQKIFNRPKEEEVKKPEQEQQIKKEKTPQEIFKENLEALKQAQQGKKQRPKMG